MEEFSMTKRHAHEVLDALLKLEMIRPCEFQHDKNMVSYETTIRGNALGMAKAGKPLKRASAGNVLWELLGRVKAVNDRQDLAYTVESVVVFGSYLSDAKRVNDLDVAVELKPRSTDDATWERLCNASHERAEAAGRRFRNVVEQVGWPQLEVLGILKNRSRTTSFCEWKSLHQTAVTMSQLCGTVQLGNPLIDRGLDWHRIKNIVRFWTDIPLSPLRLYRGGGVWSQICQKLTRIGWVAR
jgi:predicted nucleotidyltransferase